MIRSTPYFVCHFKACVVCLASLCPSLMDAFRVSLELGQKRAGLAHGGGRSLLPQFRNRSLTRSGTLDTARTRPPAVLPKNITPNRRRGAIAIATQEVSRKHVYKYLSFHAGCSDGYDWAYTGDRSQDNVFVTYPLSLCRCVGERC